MSRYDFKAMRDNLRGGGAVRVVTANQLFPTPPHVAQRAAELLGLDDWQGEHCETLRVLEPSAGTGALLDAARAAAPDAHLVAAELNVTLAAELMRKYAGPGCDVVQGDFLLMTPGGPPLQPFDAVLMNPPFERGTWKKHLRHAWRFVKPGGRLVAVLPQAPGVQEVCRELCGTGSFEPLPEGTFAGTNVRTLLALLEME